MINILRKKASYLFSSYNLKIGVFNYKYEHVNTFTFYFSFAFEKTWTRFVN